MKKQTIDEILEEFSETFLDRERECWHKAYPEYVKTFLKQKLQQIKDQQREEIEATFIADLYLCRSKMIRPIGFREQQDPQEVLQYNWMNTIISQLSDKYEVKHNEVKEILSTN